jgi:NADPH-dependent glutamate synthase beta subunit-like oxidoreductase
MKTCILANHKKYENFPVYFRRIYNNNMAAVRNLYLIFRLLAISKKICTYNCWDIQILCGLF